jgi:prepilin-type N-terminal cleavage/methylation domain-containing protein/prepilin-type processing-associated H-X9-DG protein
MHTRHTKPRRGFTLVELLVVIGIIAILIAILMPSLNSARRQARAVRCLSNLKQVGNAFFMYSQQYKGAWPVAVHDLSGVHIPIDEERRWSDLLAEFVSGSGVQMTKATDIAAIRRNSVLWGCPEWDFTDTFDPNDFAQSVRNGYGMNYYPSYFDDFDLTKLAYVTAGRGQYIRQARWTKSSQRALVLDSITHVVGTPPVMDSVNGRWFPYDFNGGVGIFGAFYVDGARHAPNARKQVASAQSKRESYTNKWLNALFCDGHAESVSVRQAWDAIHNPGAELSGP